MKKINDGHKPRYLFKITVIGPEDKLLEQVLSVFNQNIVAVDGIRIGAGDLEMEETDVRALIMSPQHAAMDILLSVTYKGASGAMIVLKESDPEIETIYRNEIRQNIGAGIPTRTVIIDSDIDDFKKQEIVHLFEGIVEEILELREKSDK
jgi:hypothetical protein